MSLSLSIPWELFKPNFSFSCIFLFWLHEAKFIVLLNLFGKIFSKFFILFELFELAQIKSIELFYDHLNIDSYNMSSLDPLSENVYKILNLLIFSEVKICAIAKFPLYSKK